MLFNLLLVIMLGYIFYKRGADYLLRARVMQDDQAEKTGYFLFLISGTILGDYLGIMTVYHYAPDEFFYQITTGTIFSILLGEAFFLYNRRMIRRIPTLQQRKN